MSRLGTLLLALVLTLTAAAPAAAQLGSTGLVNETFANADVSNPNFRVGGTIDTASADPCLTAGTNTAQTPIRGCPSGQPAIPSGGDPQGQGALRLTSNTANSTGFVLYQDALPFTAGLDVTFSFFAYRSMPTSTGTGADGVTFFLSDGSKPLVRPGAFGGSIGYAQRNTPFLQDGLLGGDAGVGFDEWGNFANNTEGRGQGCNQPYTGLFKDYITLRGAGNGQSFYCVIERKDVSAYGSIDNPGAQSRTAANVKRTAHITVDPLSAASPHIRVELAYGGGAYQPVLDAPLGSNPPPTFKFGFAAGTGGANNIHEIQNTLIRSILPLPRLRIAKTNTGPFTVGGPGRFVLTASSEAGEGIGAVQSPVTVVDDLPAGTLAGDPTGDGWDCSASSGVHVRCTRPASPQAPIAPGTAMPSITVNVAFGTNESGIFDNPAVVDSEDNANTPEQSSTVNRFRVLPTGQDDSATTTVGQPVGVSILDNDHGSLRPDSVTITRDPAHGTVIWDINSEQAVYTPDPGFSGIDTFTYRVLDQDGQPVNQTVTITVTPQAQDDFGQTPAGTPVTLDILANDLGNLNPASVAVLSPPAHGTVTFDPATGRATYTPAPGFTGRDTFVYTVRDRAGQITQATVTIDVFAGPTPPPEPPTPPPPALDPADLAITKVVSPRRVAVGDVLTYTVTITNRGPDTAYRTVGVDIAKGRARFLSVRPVRGTCSRTPRAKCSVGALAPHGKVTVVARVRPLRPGTLRNVVVVTAATPDPNLADNRARASARVTGTRLAIAKRASRRRVRTGQTVAFRMRITNRSRTTAHAVVVCDRLPGALAHVSGGTRRGARVCWRLRSLAPRRSRTFVLRARAVASRTRLVTNVASVRARGARARTARARVVIVGRPRFTG